MSAAAPVRAEERSARSSSPSARSSSPSSEPRKPFNRYQNGKSFNSAGAKEGRAHDAPKPEPKILFQSYFRSVGTRTYAAQVKEAGTGNHFILLTEGRRDEKTGEVRKTRLIVFSEDFPEFFRLLEKTNKFVQQNPVAPDVVAKQEARWRKQKENHR